MKCSWNKKELWTSTTYFCAHWKARSATDGIFSHLLVDEFQDINDLQYRLIRHWNRGGQGLFVIGDPDQAIYGFRGADSDCFARLKKDLPDLREIRLVQNYRSTPQILSTALCAIAPNPACPYPAAQPPCRETGSLDGNSGRFCRGHCHCTEIAQMTGGLGMLEAHRDDRQDTVRSFSEIAVLCRTHRQAQLVENVCGTIASPAWSPGGRIILPTMKYAERWAFSDGCCMSRTHWL